MIMREHQLVGSFTGTLSSTPSRMSLSNPAFTWLAQCTGMGAGVCTATGLASLSMNSLIGGLSFMRGRGCLSHILKALAAYLERM